MSNPCAVEFGTPANLDEAKQLKAILTERMIELQNALGNTVPAAGPGTPAFRQYKKWRSDTVAELDAVRARLTPANDLIRRLNAEKRENEQASVRRAVDVLCDVYDLLMSCELTEPTMEQVCLLAEARRTVEAHRKNIAEGTLKARHLRRIEEDRQRVSA